MYTWLVHLGDLIVLMAACHGFRILARIMFKPEFQILAEEFISTLDFCGSCFELAFIYEIYGILPFAVSLFIACYWWSLTFGDAAVNPNKHVEDYVRGNAKHWEAGLKIFAELLAGKFVWNLVRYIWSFELSHDHGVKSHEVICEADLVVPVWKGALVEFVLTFIDRLNALTSEDFTILQNNLFVSLLSTGLVVAGLNFSGGYFNPVLATSLKLGCKGHSTLEFFIVYWIASILGSMVALQSYLIVIRRFTKSSPPKRKLSESGKKKIK